MYALLFIVFSLAASALADLSCVPFKPFGWHHTEARIQFSGGKALLEATNVVAGNPLRLATANQTGTVFEMESCTSSSLNIAPSQTWFYFSDGYGCRLGNTSFVRVIHPSTGHCITAKNRSAERPTLVFEPCNAAPTDLSQIWQVDQRVDFGGYEYNCGGAIYIGPAYFDAVNPNISRDGYVEFTQWTTAPDHRTLEVYGGMQSSLRAEMVKP